MGFNPIGNSLQWDMIHGLKLFFTELTTAQLNELYPLDSKLDVPLKLVWRWQ
jgi:hypothetical protein